MQTVTQSKVDCTTCMGIADRCEWTIPAVCPNYRLNTYMGPPVSTNLRSLIWLAPDPIIKHREGAEYALAPDARYCFERVPAGSGRYSYRVARWSDIPVDAEWGDLPDSIWTSVDEVGEPIK